MKKVFYLPSYLFFVGFAVKEIHAQDKAVINIFKTGAIGKRISNYEMSLEKRF
jgi:hypothetical protein